MIDFMRVDNKTHAASSNRGTVFEALGKEMGAIFVLAATKLQLMYSSLTARM